MNLATLLVALRDPDLLISNGLANYETLRGRGESASYLFLCKCALHVEAFDVTHGTVFAELAHELRDHIPTRLTIIPKGTG